MHGLNRIFLMGRLGADPQSNTAKSGTPFTSLSIATHRTFATDEGQEKHTDWHSVLVWGKQAETCMKYLSKGQPVLVEGYLTQYSTPGEDGVNRRKTGVQAIRVEFLPRTMNQEDSTHTHS